MLIPLQTLFEKYNIQSSGILHCGASTGQEAEAYNQHGIKNVIWVEAIPDVYEELKRHVEPYGHLCINVCVSDVDGEMVNFNISNNEGQSSSFLELGVHKEIHPTVHYVNSIELETKRLDSILKDIDISSINFINFDLQGAELKALKGMGDILKQIDYCYLEVNKKETYVGCGLIDDVDEYLSRYGFVRVETAEWVSDTWSDAFYIKK
jgi:FkbM family methyltransferase